MSAKNIHARLERINDFVSHTQQTTATNAIISGFCHSQCVRSFFSLSKLVYECVLCVFIFFSYLLSLCQFKQLYSNLYDLSLRLHWILSFSVILCVCHPNCEYIRLFFTCFWCGDSHEWRLFFSLVAISSYGEKCFHTGKWADREWESKCAQRNRESGKESYLVGKVLQMTIT